MYTCSILDGNSSYSTTTKFEINLLSQKFFSKNARFEIKKSTASSTNAHLSEAIILLENLS